MQWEQVCRRIGNAATTTEDIVLTGESEVGLTVVFGDALKRVSLNCNSVLFDVVGE
ncbi:hypothetical protein [Haladaptatus sp. DFWS20]|uniref:hypothetical protein n=1 Tax=Haladaptatus sp. DFWS20 TaxID=3403467 RepID=UPI003EC0A909